MARRDIGRRDIGRRDTGMELLLNPVACDGIGMCTQLAPDRVTTDSWGFPVVLHGELSDDESRQAERAVAGCPKRALMLVPSKAPASRGR
jgi:ferredoxin